VSSFYDTGLQGLLERTIPAEAGVYVVGVNDEYTFNKGHSDFTPITPHIILPETQLQNVTNTAGIPQSRRRSLGGGRRWNRRSEFGPDWSHHLFQTGGRRLFAGFH
jgi:hypothetical protein